MSIENAIKQGFAETSHSTPTVSWSKWLKSLVLM